MLSGLTRRKRGGALQARSKLRTRTECMIETARLAKVQDHILHLPRLQFHIHCKFCSYRSHSVSPEWLY